MTSAFFKKRSAEAGLSLQLRKKKKERASIRSFNQRGSWPRKEYADESHGKGLPRLDYIFFI
jgi:hypothetical protein